MSKIVETTINDWSGGVVNDPRDKSEKTARMVSSFDIITNPHKMTPYRASESGNDGATLINIQNFQVALQTGTTYALYGMGRGTASAIQAFGRKALNTSGAPDLSDATWTDQSNGSSTSANNKWELFIYYRQTQKIYFATAGTHLGSLDIPSVTVNNSEFAVSYTNVAQGLVHSKDDILYIPIDNKIYRKNGTNDFELALTLPSHFYITSLCEYGDKIGIAMAPLSGQQSGQSRVFIWDRDTSLTTLSETIPWEEGLLQVLDVVDGYLVGISLSGNTTVRFNQKILFRYLAGSNVEGYRAEKLFEIQSTSTSVGAQLPIAKQIQDGRLFFLMVASIGSTTREGIWSLGRVGDRFTLIHEMSPTNDLSNTTSGTMRGFFLVGDYRFLAYDESGTYTLRKTADGTAAYNSARWEKRFATESSSIKKQLVGLSISIEPITPAGTDPILYLYFRTDANTAWTRIFRWDAVANTGTVSKEAVNIEAFSSTVTISIATPAVVTLNSHELVAGQKVIFTTTGALPTGINANQPYYVISSGLAANSFQISESIGGSAVNTSGSQSGTHTMTRLDNFPEYKEIEFRIQTPASSSYLVEPTELYIKEKVLDSRPF